MHRALAAGLAAGLLLSACGKKDDKGDNPPPKPADPGPRNAPGKERTVGVLGAGTPAPDFTATSFDGKVITLSALRGRPVVLYFYPKDETPG
jgi:cytochrome oxidase Cu insertion factor (SCO1/SenC/PrrC family)